MMMMMIMMILLPAPVLDTCLQQGSTSVLGPVWVSKGERFSPTGVREFLSGLMMYTKAKVKEAKRYQKQASAGLLLLLQLLQQPTTIMTVITMSTTNTATTTTTTTV